MMSDAGSSLLFDLDALPAWSGPTSGMGRQGPLKTAFVKCLTVGEVLSTGFNTGPRAAASPALEWKRSLLAVTEKLDEASSSKGCRFYFQDDAENMAVVVDILGPIKVSPHPDVSYGTADGSQGDGSQGDTRTAGPVIPVRFTLLSKSDPQYGKAFQLVKKSRNDVFSNGFQIKQEISVRSELPEIGITASAG
jgi:hypothetical protein